MKKPSEFIREGIRDSAYPIHLSPELKMIVTILDEQAEEIARLKERLNKVSS